MEQRTGTRRGRERLSEPCPMTLKGNTTGWWRAARAFNLKHWAARTRAETVVAFQFPPLDSTPSAQCTAATSSPRPDSMVRCAVSGQDVAPSAIRHDGADGTELRPNECACGGRFVGMQTTPFEAVTAEESSTSVRQKTSAHGGGRAQTVAECRLLRLPPALLGHVWPAERAVLGMRVCQQLQRDLMVHNNSIVLVQKKAAKLSVGGCLEDFRRFPKHVMVRLRWRWSWERRNAAERLAGLLGECKALTHLDLNDNDIGKRGAGRLAGVLGKCKALTHLDLSRNLIRAEGAGRLAGVLGKCKALAHLDLSGNWIGLEG
eukprot:1271169-Rhodomonas_salina.1